MTSTPVTGTTESTAELTEDERALLPTDEDVRFYAEHGWYLSGKLFTDAEIDALVEASERFYAGERRPDAAGAPAAAGLLGRPRRRGAAAQRLRALRARRDRRAPAQAAHRRGRGPAGPGRGDPDLPVHPDLQAAGPGRADQPGALALRPALLAVLHLGPDAHRASSRSTTAPRRWARSRWSTAATAGRRSRATTPPGTSPTATRGSWTRCWPRTPPTTGPRWSSCRSPSPRDTSTSTTAGRTTAAARTVATGRAGRSRCTCRTGDNRYRSFARPSGEPVVYNHDVLVRRDPAGDPDYADPAFCPSLWRSA